MRVIVADGAGLEQILDESYPIWSDGLTRENYGRYNAAQLRTPWGATHLRRLLLIDDGGEVLSSAKRYDLRAQLDGRPISVVGIGAVFTPASKRGHGYARTLVERLVREAADAGADMALLFSEIDPAYYAGLGFVPVPRHTFELALEVKPGAPAVLVRTAEARDLPAVAALARSMAQPHRFSPEYTDDFVRFSVTKKRLLAGLLEPELLTVEFFIVEEGISAAAFCLLTVTRDDIVLEMCGDRDPSGARVGAMLQVLRARRPAEGVPRISCFLPPGWCPPQVRVESRQIVREVMMVRPLRAGVLQRPLEEQDVLYWHGDLF